MKIAIIGATGYTGTHILSEALKRGHEVTAIARNVSKISPSPKLTVLSLDITRTSELAVSLANHDVVVSAFNPGKDESGLGVKSIINAAITSAAPRLLVVGGAGSLEIAPGKRIVDQPDFPAQWKDGALKTAAFLNTLRGETKLNWTFLSPALNLVPGERTGSYQTGSDRAVVDRAGESRISTADLAVAMLDEVEKPQHIRKRFTVAY